MVEVEEGRCRKLMKLGTLRERGRATIVDTIEELVQRVQKVQGIGGGGDRIRGRRRRSPNGVPVETV